MQMHQRNTSSERASTTALALALVPHNEIVTAVRNVTRDVENALDVFIHQPLHATGTEIDADDYTNWSAQRFLDAQTTDPGITAENFPGRDDVLAALDARIEDVLRIECRELHIHCEHDELDTCDELDGRTGNGVCHGPAAYCEYVNPDYRR